MANPITQSFASLVTNWVSAAQGATAKLVDFTIGSILRAIADATGYVGLWLQGLALQGLALARAATSNGSDLDSWFAQFGFARLPAVAATMQETFGRYTATAQALIYPGATVQSQNGYVVFQVIADTTNANYSATLGAYVLPAGTTSIPVTVQCTTAGSAGNVQANMITALSTSISGVDYVTNAAAAINGVDAELDAPARARFVLWIASLEAATMIAVMSAVADVQQGMSAIIAENVQYNGQTQNGYFTAIINNGSGTTTSTELTNASNAIEATRPLCVTYGTHASTQVAANVSLTVTVASGYVSSSVTGAVQAALQNYINAIQTTSSGATLPWSSIAGQAYDIPGVENVTNVLLNGATADLAITYQEVFQAGAIVVSAA